MIDCLAVTVKREGVLSLWSGWTPYFARTAPLTVITLMLMDVCLYQYKNIAYKLKKNKHLIKTKQFVFEKSNLSIDDKN